MFNCKAFSLFKKINALKKIKKLKSRAFIKYLIKYNFINIVKNDSQIDLIIYLTSIDDWEYWLRKEKEKSIVQKMFLWECSSFFLWSS
jgi:alpha-L-arabinofuranosidase